MDSHRREESLVAVVEGVVRTEGKSVNLPDVLLKNSGQHRPEILIELGRKRSIMGQLGKLTIDRPNHLDVVVPNELQVLLLVLLGSCSQAEQEVLVQPALLVLLPVGKLEVVLPAIAQQPDHLQQKFEEGQHQHAPCALLQHEGLDVLDRPVAGLGVLELGA